MTRAMTHEATVPEAWRRPLRWVDLMPFLPTMDESRAKIRELDAIADILHVRRPSTPKAPWEVYWAHLTTPVTGEELRRVEAQYEAQRTAKAIPEGK